MNDSVLAMGDPRIGIIGAGLSGLMAARILQQRGASVTVFDKARRPGGRANTREHGSYRFDHGAQFFTVRDPAVRPYLKSWLEQGVAAEWTGSLVRIKAGEVEPAKATSRYVGTPGMINISAYLSRGLDVRVKTRVASLRPVAAGLAMDTEEGERLGPFDAVVVAVPAPQALPLLTQVPEFQSHAGNAVMAPCWAGMYIFEDPLALEFDGAFISGGTLSWVARDSSKPGRPKEDAWVLHAGPEWTLSNQAMDQEEASAALLKEFESSFGARPNVVFHRAHRWAYALAQDGVPGGALYDAELRIGVCGDWCRGGRVEGALQSGMALADRILPAGSSAPAAEC